MAKVSVIVPIYNAEEYLGRCLDSLLAQTYKDIEILCVNDGSTDNSLRLLEQYGDFDSKIKIFNQIQQGPSAARNSAIEAANGEYILFADSDDYLSSVAVENILKFAQENKTDVVIFDYIHGDINYSSWQRISNPHLLNRTGNNTFNADSINIQDYKYIPVTVWSKFYKSKIIKNNKIRFVEGIYYEDVPFWAEIFCAAKAIKYLPVPYYFYNTFAKNSIMKQNDNKVFDVFTAYQNVIGAFEKNNLFDKYKPAINLLIVMDLLKKFETVSPEFRQEYYSKLKNFSIDIDFNLYESSEFTDFEKNYIGKFKTFLTTDYKTFCNIMGVAQ